ncbi:MAG TPA: helix-turn-helix transcriptional regulator [Candidatus Eisenbacteria bacterium]|nr:helix-turn-helix transcriptional regulator [Candidatus Eisenbacteria bacterium]
MAIRLGIGLRESRRASGLTQAEAADRIGISQPRWSELERAEGDSASIATWAAAAAAVERQLAAFIEQAPGANQPNDLEHLRRQNALIEIARSGGWQALPELAIDRDAAWSRAIDVALIRSHRSEAAAVEIWDWIADGGAALRSFDAKVNALGMHLDRHQPLQGPPPWTVRGLFIVRDTSRNRVLVGELRALFHARFSASSVAWLAALTRPDRSMPETDGLVWSSANGKQLRPSRLGRG